MRKYSQGGGIYNIMDANTKWPIPAVGDGATFLLYSDRWAGTVVDVFTKGKTTYVRVQRDTSVRTDTNEFSELQSYSFSRNPSGLIATFKRDKAGRWVEVVMNPETGRYNGGFSGSVKFGERDEYFDFSF